MCGTHSLSHVCTSKKKKSSIPVCRFRACTKESSSRCSQSTSSGRVRVVRNMAREEIEEEEVEEEGLDEEEVLEKEEEELEEQEEKEEEDRALWLEVGSRACTMCAVVWIRVLFVCVVCVVCRYCGWVCASECGNQGGGP